MEVTPSAPDTSHMKKQTRKRTQKTRNPGKQFRKELQEIKEAMKLLRVNRPKPRVVRKNRLGQGVSLARAPVSLGANYVVTQPRFLPSKEGSIIVKHKEFASVVPGSEQMNMTRFRINPAEASTFPWLFYVAQGFEKFKVKELVAHYIPVVSTSEQGSVFMYPEYQVEDPLIVDPKKILNMEGAVSGALWRPHSMKIAPNKFNQLKSYVIRNPYENPTSYLLYDPCNVNIGIAGAGDTIDVGQLYFEYTIELMVASSDSGINLDFGILQFANAPFVDYNGTYIPSFVNAALTPRCGTWSWHFNSNNGLVFEDDWCGVLVFSVAVSNGFDTDRPFIGAITGTIQLFLSFQSIQDTLVSGQDTITVWYSLKASKGSIFYLTGGYLGESGGSASGLIALYPSPVNFWNTPDPTANPSFSLPPVPEVFPVPLSIPEEKEELSEEIMEIKKLKQKSRLKK